METMKKRWRMMTNWDRRTWTRVQSTPNFIVNAQQPLRRKPTIMASSKRCKSLYAPYSMSPNLPCPRSDSDDILSPPQKRARQAPQSSQATLVATQDSMVPSFTRVAKQLMNASVSTRLLETLQVPSRPTHRDVCNGRGNSQGQEMPPLNHHKLLASRKTIRSKIKTRSRMHCWKTLLIPRNVLRLSPILP